MAVSIVPFARAHGRAVLSLFQDVFAREPWNELWSEREVISRLEGVRLARGGRGWVAVDGARVVGFVFGCEVAPRSDGARAFSVQEMAVAFTRQGQGIGTRLLRHAEEAAARDGYDVVEVLTAAMEWPCRFYVVNGYRQVGPIDDGQLILARPVTG